MRYRLFFAAAVFLNMTMLSAFAQDARAEAKIGEGYATPTYREVMQTVVIMGGADINKQEVADEYGSLVYCSIYKKIFKNDFEWNNIRRQIVTRILEQREMYRTHYELRGVVNLGRYDFERQVFPLTEDTKLVRVGRMNVISEGEYSPPCPDVERGEGQFVFPTNVDLFLNQYLMVEEIKIPPEAAEMVIKEMQKMRVVDRSVFVRFRFRVTDKASMEQDILGRRVRADLVGQIQQVDFFLDKEMTKWIASAPTAPR